MDHLGRLVWLDNQVQEVNPVSKENKARGEKRDLQDSQAKMAVKAYLVYVGHKEQEVNRAQWDQQEKQDQLVLKAKEDLQENEVKHVV